MTQDEIILQSEIERCGEARFYPTSSSMRPTINPRKDGFLTVNRGCCNGY